MEATPQSVYNAVLMDKWRIQDASGVSLVSAYIMNTSVQLEFEYEN